MSFSLKKIMFSIILFSGLSHQPAHAMKELIQEYLLAPYVIFESIILGSYFALSYHTDPKAPWYLHFPFAYNIGTQLTDLSQFITSRMLFARLRNSGLTKKKQIQWCKTQLENIKQQSLEKEKSITKEILAHTAFNLDDYQKKFLWPLLTVADEYKPTTDGYCDTSLDDFTLINTKKLLQKYKLNPDCYAIKQSDKIQSLACHQDIEYDNIYSTPTISTTYSHREIIFNSNQYSSLPKNYKLAVIAHEVTHGAQKHGAKRLLLRPLINYIISNEPLSKTEIATIRKKGEIIETTHEEQAEIIPSVDDSSISSHMRSWRKNNFYPGNLYFEHYNTLSTINELHKIIQWLHTAPASKQKPYNTDYQLPKIVEPRIPQHKFPTNSTHKKQHLNNRLLHTYHYSQHKALIFNSSFGEHK